jgi:hypothetical protein
MFFRFIVFSFFIIQSSFSYSQFQLSGTVTTEAGLPLSNASLALVYAKDSQLVKGDITDDKGNYSFSNMPKGEYKLLISKLGYERFFSDKIDLNTSQKLDFKLKQNAKKMKDVNIIATKPLFEQRADKLIVNVANSPIAIGGTAQEILKKVPGVVVVQDKITLAGNNNVQIWIDGKPSVYQDINAVLSIMPGDQIEKIELIKQPGAKYDAGGGSIINIVLKRNAKQGLNGTAQVSMNGFQVDQTDVDRGIREYGRINPSLSLNYRKGLWNIFGSGSYVRSSNFQVLNIGRFIGNTTFKSPTIIESNINVFNLSLGTDYYVSKQTTIGLLFKAFKSTNNRVNNNLTNVYENTSNTLTNSFYTDNHSTSNNANYSANFNLKHNFDTITDHSLNFDLDYVRYQLDINDNIEIYPSSNLNSKSFSQQKVEQPVNIIVGKLDYTRPLDSNMKIEWGLKSSFATIDNNLQFYKNGILSPLQSFKFLYKENINAGYLNFNKQFKKLELNIGLRAEQTIATGTSENNTELLNRNYIQLFPNLSLMYKLNKQMGIQLAYSKRINRPSFNQQNPFRKFIDSLTYQSGNPNLFPEMAHSGQLSVVYEGQPFLSVEYNVTDDVIIDNAPQLEGNTTFTTAANLAKKYSWAFQANFPIKFGKFIDGYGGNQFIYNHYKAEYLGGTYDASRWHWLAYFDVNFKLPNDFNAEIGGFYLTKFLEEFITIGSLSGIDIGVSKTFMEKRARLSFNFSDILYGQKTNGVILYNDIRAEFLQREFSQNLRLSFSYNFGNTKLKKQRSRKTGAESESNRVKTDK